MVAQKGRDILLSGLGHRQAGRWRSCSICRWRLARPPHRQLGIFAWNRAGRSQFACASPEEAGVAQRASIPRAATLGRDSANRDLVDAELDLWGSWTAVGFLPIRLQST